jgi:anhydro-N-acetylmuramic acid kinase
VSECFIGLMSGTSLDGVDGVLVDFAAAGAGALPMRVIGHEWLPFDEPLRQELLALNSPGHDQLHRAALAGNALARLYARLVAQLLKHCNVPGSDVRAIGAHGQTVRHRPGAFDGTGYTVQVNQPALLAELTHIDVVADFRSRDVAAGGQGAPLVPAFHQALLAREGYVVGVLNLGGIANLTLLGAHGDGSVTGFDCGPANVLLDGWHQRHRGGAYDAAGAWAASGHVQPDLLARMLSEPYFALPPPKSTGRDLFNQAWLDGHLAVGAPLAAADVQATLAELTACSIAADVQRHAPAVRDLWLCGGGAFNADLRARLQRRLPGVTLRSTEAIGLPPTQVEAAAFAWLARAFVHAQSGNLVSVTGARGARRLGAWYPSE